jgi:pilus assembly protein CpaF
MGLHDRLNRSGSAAAVDLHLATVADDEPIRAHDPYAELKTRVHHEVIATLGAELFKQDANEDLSERVLRSVTEQLTLDRTPLTREERRQLVREITDDILGYGPLEPFLRDDSVTEVMVNAHDRIYIERGGRLERTNAAFVDNPHLMRIIDKIVSQVGRRVDESSPLVDARLPDGSRVNAIIPPLALRGPTLRIGKFARDPYTMNDLIGFGTVTGKSAQFLSCLLYTI